MSLVPKLIFQSEPYWSEYVQHKFVQQISDGTLPMENFQHFLKQDYHYLFQYARSLSLAMFKSENFEQMNVSREVLNCLYHEINTHIQYCKEWGEDNVSLSQIEESSACIAYTRYVLDCGMSGGLAELYTAIAPCAIGYAKIARQIKQNQLLIDNNPYQFWIDSYSAEPFQKSARELSDFLEELCGELSESQLVKIQHIFTTATRMEIAFWQMGLDLS